MSAVFASGATALRVLCPPLYAEGEAIYTPWLDMAVSSLGVAGWGDRYYEAVALVAAHEWTRLTGGSPVGLSPTASEAVGAVASESSGVMDRSLSRSYAAPTPIEAADAEWHSTRYGIAFLKIRNTRAAFGTRVITL